MTNNSRGNPLSSSDRDALFGIVRKQIEWQQLALTSLKTSCPFAERFQITGILGQGSFGIVFRATDKNRAADESQTGGEIALKLMRMQPDVESQGVIEQSKISNEWYERKRRLLDNWITEIDRNKQMGNMRGCVPILAASVPESTDLKVVLNHVEKQPIWFTMPVYRQTLDDYMTTHGKDGKLGEFAARKIMVSVAETLQQIHNFKPPSEQDRELVHRDLKPANILLDDAGNPFVADFGLASGRHEQRFQGNPIRGTPSYMAPEQHRGQEATQQTDIFAWGVIFYQLLSGRLPFTGGDAKELTARIISGVPPEDLSHQPGIPDYLAQVVMRCLSTPLDRVIGRYGSFRSVLDAMSEGEHRLPRPPLLRFEPNPNKKATADPGILDLRYDIQWLDYWPRPDIRSLLRGFIDHQAPFLWWGMIGEGGVGKSREAFELALELTNEGWDAGFLQGRNTDEWLQRDCRVWRPQRSTLILVDYAAIRAPALLDGLQHLNQTQGDRGLVHPKVRLLLLDRPGRVYPVASELIPDQPHGGEIRDRVRKSLYAHPDKPADEPRSDLESRLSSGLAKPLVRDQELLRILPFQQEDWRAVLIQAIAQTGGPQSQVPEIEQIEWWDRVDRLTDGGRPLFLQVLGLCLARNPALVSGLSASDGLNTLLDEMLAHESENRWPDLFPREPGSTREAIRKTAAYQHVLHGAAFITLARGLTLPEHADALLQTAGGSPESLRNVLPRLLRIDASKDQQGQTHIHLPPLEPDLIGERLLLRLLPQKTGAADPFGLESPAPNIDQNSWLRNALEVNPTGTLQTVQLLAQDFPLEPGTMEWVAGVMAVLKQHSATTDSVEVELAAIDQLPGIFITLTKGFAPVTGELWTEFLTFVTEYESRWDSAFRALISAIPEFVPRQPSSERFHEILSQITNVARLAEWSEESHVLLSKGAFNAVNDYGGAGDWESLERWGGRLVRQGEKFPELPEIQLELDNGAFNAVNYYGGAGDWESLERWGGRLLRQGEKFPEHPEIQLELAKGAFNAVYDYGGAGDWESLERWGGVLKESLHQAAVDANTFSQMLRIVLSRANNPETSCWLDILLTLVDYWPGFVLEQDGSSVPILTLVANCQLDASQKARINQLAQRVADWSAMNQQLPNTDQPAAVAMVRTLWQNRMYSPDRGDSLIPWLQKCGLQRELQQAALDPWRRQA